MGKRLTLEQKNKVVELHNQGETYEEIGRIVGCSGVTASKVVKTHTEDTESEDTEDNSQEDLTSAIADVYQKIIDAKDAHIVSLEKVIDKLTAVKA